MRRMHNPAHPGKVLRKWLPEGMTVTTAAAQLSVSRVMLSKILNGRAGISADMALRLSAWLDTTPEVWLKMQTARDLWEAAQKPRPVIRPLRQAA